MRVWSCIYILGGTLILVHSCKFHGQNGVSQKGLEASDGNENPCKTPSRRVVLPAGITGATTRSVKSNINANF